MRFLKSIEKSILRSSLKSDRETQERILSGAVEALQKQKRSGGDGKPHHFRQAVIRYKRVEMIAAAVIIVAVLGATWYFSGSIDASGVAWARVPQRVSQTDSFTYRQRTATGTLGEAETVLYYSPEHGVRLGTYTDGKINTRKFILPAEKIVITIMPQEKKYTKKPLSAEKSDLLQQSDSLKKLIRQFMRGKYKELGRDTIDGISVYGIETKGIYFDEGMFKNALGRLWVNSKTNLPVRMELHGRTPDGRKVKMVTDEFRWDAKLSAADFGPNISTDYTLNSRENDNSN